MHLWKLCLFVWRSFLILSSNYISFLIYSRIDSTCRVCASVLARLLGKTDEELGSVRAVKQTRVMRISTVWWRISVAVSLQPECTLCSDSVRAWSSGISLCSSTGTEGFAMLVLTHSESPCREGDGSDEGGGSESSGLQASEMQLWILSIHCCALWAFSAQKLYTLLVVFSWRDS